MHWSRNTKSLLVCALVVLLAGCTGFGFDEGVSEDELLDKLDDADLPEDMQAVVESHGTFENESFSADYEMWARQDGTMRIEGALDEHRYVDVNDGEQVWSHNTSDDTVEVRDPFDDNSMIHDLREVTTEVLRTQEVSTIQETELDGRDVYHITLDLTDEDDDSSSSFVPSLVPESDGIISEAGADDGSAERGDPMFGAPGTEALELWVDSEYFLLVKQVAGDDDFETRYTDVEFDVGLEDDHFEFEIPPDATVEEVDTPEFEEFDTVEDAQNAVPFEFDEPDIESHSLEGVTVMTQDEDDFAQVTLEYWDGAKFPLIVEVRNEPGGFDISGETVEIGDGTTGQESATYEQLEGEVHRVFWDTDDRYYSVITGTDVDRDDLLDMVTEVMAGT